MRVGLFVLLFIVCTRYSAYAQVYHVKESKVDFMSEAPQESINASSDKLTGILDPARNTFAFSMAIVSFKGFNNPLQREHFNENYMETDKYPEAKFSGKIIEDINVSKDGTYRVRAKGKLYIHGVEQERIVYVHIKTAEGKIKVGSEFVISLPDHKIKIPRLVYGKLAKDIKVTLSAILSR